MKHPTAVCARPGCGKKVNTGSFGLPRTYCSTPCYRKTFQKQNTIKLNDKNDTV